ncbi:MAG: aminoglycoside phosphotransferase family protein [Candidatus Poribacteria bacterium]|nr:aminoglycoside phosphotransferase family protein [Candidatus Poribacteria bacterium]
MDFPASLQSKIESTLKQVNLTIQPLPGGMNDRTFLVTGGDHEWVARVDGAEETGIRRAVRAQGLAFEAGVAVPEIITHDDDGEWQWAIEERVNGDPFETNALPSDRNHALSRHLGRQLRRLHTARREEFGLIEPNPYPSFARFTDWLDNGERHLPEAASLADLSASTVDLIRDAYSLLRESPTDPRLTHGDCAGGNILVRENNVVALIDWEWASGGDPTHNLAYWDFWNDDPSLIDALLEGYEPDNTVEMRRRVAAHHFVVCVEVIRVYHEFGDPDGIADARERLTSAKAMERASRTGLR